MNANRSLFIQLFFKIVDIGLFRKKTFAIIRNLFFLQIKSQKNKKNFMKRHGWALKWRGESMIERGREESGTTDVSSGFVPTHVLLRSRYSCHELTRLCH